jgi:mRNA interferase RelE/StbE
MAWQFEFKSGAKRALQRLDRPVQRQLLRALDELVAELTASAGPVLSDVRKLKGSDDLFRLRSGDWRVIFGYEHDRLVVLVLELGYRSEIYRSRD